MKFDKGSFVSLLDFKVSAKYFFGHGDLGSLFNWWDGIVQVLKGILVSQECSRILSQGYWEDFSINQFTSPKVINDTNIKHAKYVKDSKVTVAVIRCIINTES
ncbi:hypothetical protein CEXT_724511 [Caerostris extrusa]|uniref:Uncharacterized protein n=1 Tax=Caerostris extrusa TaxID=172846 RepID=A0AAV4QME4_CAEEX|nr:hypothetical protein CEXT_724511 [Caerostris extrusa]